MNGDTTNHVQLYLKQKFSSDITWNFASEFVIGRDGIPSARFDSSQSWDDLENQIKQNW